jgi:hypothetical protein
MCFPAPSLPSRPGAPPSPPHSPTSVPTPGPTAIPSSPLAPKTASTPLAAGRSKALRWRDGGSPAFSPVDSPGLHRRRPSYKEALLLPRAAPCLGREADNGAGWVKVEGRQARRRRLRPLKSPPLLPRVVPSDLRGKCFNCLSPSHRAAACRRLVRCFCCRLPGHRAYVCPRRRSGIPQPRRGLVWRPVSQSSGMAGSGDSSAGRAEAGGIDDVGRLKKRTRRGQRRRRSGSQRNSEDQEAAVEVPAQHCAEQSFVHATGRTTRIIKYSRKILQEEENLRRALIITVFDQTNSGCAADVSEALAARFSLDAQSLDLRRAAPNSYVAFLPSEEVACRVLNGGMPFVFPTVRLHIKRWSRHALAVGGRALPVPVDIELRGILAHLWGLETASLLLDEHCLIRDVHPASAEGVDLSVFKLSAWCDEPGLVPTELDLLAEEPRACDSDPSPRTLVFPISVQVFRSDGILDSSSLPPPPPPYSGDDREQDHDKRRKSPHSKPTATVRRPVHARLGPSARAGSARIGSAARDGSACLGPCVRADSAPGGTVALPVPLGEGSAASVSPPLARDSASGWTSASVELPGASAAEVFVGTGVDASEGFVGTGVDASGSPLPSFIPSVSPGPVPVPISPGPPHGTNFQTMEEFGGCHRTGQNSERLCIVHSDQASVPNMQDPRVPITIAAQVRDPWEIIKHSL